MNWSKDWPVPVEPSCSDPNCNDPNCNYDNAEPPVWPFVDISKEEALASWPVPASTTPNPTTDPNGFVKALEASPAWPKPVDPQRIENYKLSDPFPLTEDMMGKLVTKKSLTYGTGIILTTFKDGSIMQTMVDPSEYHNKAPTHDPYTNPDAHIYHECACGAILDPGTKSFAALNNAASYAGWKIRWGHDSYKAHCVECGKGVE